MNPSPDPVNWPESSFDLIVDMFDWRALCINQWAFIQDKFYGGYLVDFYFEPPLPSGINLAPGKSGFFKRIDKGSNLESGSGWVLNGVRHAMSAVINATQLVETPAQQVNSIEYASSRLNRAVTTTTDNRLFDPQPNSTDCGVPKRYFGSLADDAFPRRIQLWCISTKTQPAFFRDALGQHGGGVHSICLVLRDQPLQVGQLYQRPGRKERKKGLSVGSTRVLKELIRLAPMKSMLRWNGKMKEDPNGGGLKKKNIVERWLNPAKEHSEQGHKIDETIDDVFKFFKHSKKPCASKEFRKAVLKAGKILTKKGIAEAYESLKKNATITAQKSLKRQIAFLKKSAKTRARRAILKKLGIPRIPKRFPSKKVLLKKLLKKGFRKIAGGGGGHH